MSAIIRAVVRDAVLERSRRDIFGVDEDRQRLTAERATRIMQSHFSWL
jgi:hypothetical protein